MSCFFTESEVGSVCYRNGVQEFGGRFGFGAWAYENGLCNSEVYYRFRDPRDRREGGYEFHVSILPDAVLEAILLELDRPNWDLFGTRHPEFYEASATEVREEIAREKQKRAELARDPLRPAAPLRTRLKFLFTGKL